MMEISYKGIKVLGIYNQFNENMLQYNFRASINMTWVYLRLCSGLL